MRRNTALLMLFGILLLAAASCRTPRETGKPKRYKGKDKKLVLQKHDATRLKFRTMSFKGKADYKNEKEGQKIGFSYKINIASDSLIWSSFSKMGFPGAMARVDSDSMHMRNTVDKEAIRCDFSLLSEMIGYDCDLQMLQNLLTGDANLTEKIELIPNKDGPIHLRGSMPPYQVSWFLNRANFKLEKMEVKDRILGRESTLSYSDFKEVGAYTVPMRIVLEVTQPTKARIELKHSSVEFDKEKTTFNFRIPKSYKIKDCGKE